MSGQHVRDLEDKLAEDLSNCRAIESLLREVFVGMKRTHDRAREDALQMHVPTIHRELDASLLVLDDLERRLPLIRAQVSQVRKVYDSGRHKAKELAHELEWLNTEWYERIRVTMFTARAPVSWRWKVLLRTVFAILLAFTAWATWVALHGAYMAHRERLVWGGHMFDRLLASSLVFS
ncbi:hypothetical protein K488DRAFT_85991 [Vararia minispora EC-137]|uniref:Uncharacterized protein n=1 Tax=Vararia minispora EC-137 TaxID=1314806 RepID=A0ACB8QKG6_9AGAM|nr:hypothetical protein K488DRAFT_85991 [Vararia minispora EC-137]